MREGRHPPPLSLILGSKSLGIQSRYEHVLAAFTTCVPAGLT